MTVGLDLLETFVRLADTDVYCNLGALDIHNLASTHRRLEAAVDEREQKREEEKYTGSATQAMHRVEMARQEIERLAEFPSLMDAVALFRKLYRTFVSLSLRRPLPPKAFEDAFHEQEFDIVLGRHVRARVVILNDHVWAGVRIFNVNVDVFAYFPNKQRPGFVMGWIEPEYTPAALERGIAVAKLFGAHRFMANDVYWRRDELWDVFDVRVGHLTESGDLMVDVGNASWNWICGICGCHGSIRVPVRTTGMVSSSRTTDIGNV